MGNGTNVSIVDQLGATKPRIVDNSGMARACSWTLAALERRHGSFLWEGRTWGGFVTFVTMSRLV